MRVLVLSLFFFAATTASAQQVYKCVDGSEVSYQSAACDGNRKAARQWDATPEAEPTTEALGQRQPQSRRNRTQSAPPNSTASTRRAGSASNRRNPDSRRPGMSRCDAAKARREAKLKSVGLKRNFDLLRNLDDTVNEACR